LLLRKVIESDSKKEVYIIKNCYGNPDRYCARLKDIPRCFSKKKIYKKFGRSEFK